MLSSGEHVDIFNTLGVGYPNAISKGYALELDDLLNDYGQGILATIDPDYVKACKVGGVVYGVPQMRDIASGKGRYVVPTRYLDEIGYDWQSKATDGETIECTIDDVDALFAQLKEKHPEMSMLWPNRTTALANSILFDAVGNDNFGVLMDYENSLEVSNLFETEEFLNTCKMFYKWNKAGYLPKDILTDTTTPQENIKAGTAISTLANWKPGAKLEQENQIGESIVYFKVLGDFTASGAVTTMNWCLNANTDDEVAAMQVLDMLYTDPKAATLLAYGEEGVDYVVGDDGFVTYPDGVTGSTVEYSSLLWLNPNQNITGVWKGNPADVYEATDAFNKTAPKSKALGFSFDNSSVMAEYTALTNVFDEYIYQVLFGFVDPETGIAEMNAKLYDAGLEKYMQAKQEALNQWAEENGVK
jgi:putative aldouronate transport system substrate-binding protein